MPDVSGYVSMVEQYGEVGHGRLEEPQWWACEHPERPIEPTVTIFQFLCVKCFPAFEMAVDDGWYFWQEDGQRLVVPEAHGDRWNWYMDETNWLVG